MQEEAQKIETNTPSGVFYKAVWRWHFYAGLYVVPFLIMLSLTGMIMLFLEYFDGRDGDKITVEPAGTPMVLSDQADFAQKTHPEGKLLQWIGGRDKTGASVFRIKEGKTNYLVAVNPYSGKIEKDWIRRNGLYDLVSDIHGELLIGVTGDRMIEIASSFGIILIITGFYLWWPRNGSTFSKFKGMFVLNMSRKGRGFWRELHGVLGTYTAILLLIFLLSGLAWAGFWGAKFVQAWSTFPAEKSKQVPFSKQLTHADMNHGAIKEVPWGLEQTPMPESGSKAGITGMAADAEINIDSVAAFAQKIGYQGRFRINFPKGETGVWSLSKNSMSGDSFDPMGDRTVHIDQYSGKILADIDFSDYSVAAKGMAVGISFHMGRMGLWNLLLNAVFCLATVLLCVSGVVMWLKRKPKGRWLAAPELPKNMPHWSSAIMVMLIVSFLFPLVGFTLIALLLLDRLVLSHIPGLKI